MKQVLSRCKTAIRSIGYLFSQVHHSPGRLLPRPPVLTLSQSDYQHSGGQMPSVGRDGEHMREEEYR